MLRANLFLETEYQQLQTIMQQFPLNNSSLTVESLTTIKELSILENIIVSSTELDLTDKNICLTGTFKNFEKFDDYYEKGYIDRVITTNLTYLPAEAKEKPYFLIADMSKFIALIIDSMNHDISIGKVMDPTEKIHRLLAKHNTSL